jgi:hypothetical protein
MATETTATQADPKSTANNIANAIKDKAAGKTAPVEKPVEGTVPKDPTEAQREKYIVNGKEVYLSPEQARAYVQKGLAFEPRMNDLARLQQETQIFLRTLRDDPGKILFSERLGSNPQQVLQKIMGSTSVSEETKEIVGQWYYNNVVAPERMTPQEKEIAELKKFKTDREAKEKLSADESAAKENAFKVQAALGEIKGKISEAMKDFNLPSLDVPIGAQIARRIADVMRLSYFSRTPVTAKEAAEKVKAEMKSYHAMFLDSLDEDNLVKELGEKNAEKVKKYFLKLAKTNDTKSTVTRSPSTKSGERKIMTEDEWHEYLDGLKKGDKR